MGDRGLRGEVNYHTEKAESAETGGQGLLQVRPFTCPPVCQFANSLNCVKLLYLHCVSNTTQQRAMSLPSLLEGEGVVVLAGLAVPHQVAGLLTQPEQRLSIRPTDRSVVPAARHGDSRGSERDGTNKRNTTQHRKSNNEGQTSLASTKQKHEQKGKMVDRNSLKKKKNIADSQLAFQRHGGVDALPQRGAAVV